MKHTSSTRRVLNTTLALLMIFSMLFAAGGTALAAPEDIDSIIIVDPPTALVRGAKVTMKATVIPKEKKTLSEEEQKVKWSLSGNKNTTTTINKNTGVLTIAADERSSSIAVKAVSVSDASIFDERDIDITTDTVDKVEITGAPLQGSVGNTYNFSAKVIGIGNGLDSVKWEMSPDTHTNTTLTNNGLSTKLFVSPSETLKSITLTVYSTLDPSKKASAEFNIVENKIESVTILNAPEELGNGNTHKFLAEVKPIDDADTTFDESVLWSITGHQSADTNIYPDGRLVIAADEPDGTITVTATSEYDNSRSDSKEISIKTAKVNGITINAVDAQSRGAQVALTYSMEATGDIPRDVTWKLEGNSSAGTRFLTGSNLVIGADETAEALTVTATSVAVPGIQGSLSIKVKQIKSVVVSPGTATVAPGSSKEFSAAVVGVNGADTSVVWSMQGNSSTNTTLDNGLLKVAANETANTIRVTATSHYDASKSSTVSVSLNTAKGWVKENGKWVYYKEDGSKATGWLNDGGKWYYLHTDGYMATGWQQINGKWYYLASSGAMTTGWQNVSGKWYYMSGSGAMQTGWIKDGGKWYYLRSSGAMATGWQNVGGKWYYMSGSGAMQTGWLRDGGKWYYLNASGVMVTGRVTIGNKTYNFNSSGALI